MWALVFVWTIGKVPSGCKGDVSRINKGARHLYGDGIVKEDVQTIRKLLVPCITAQSVSSSDNIVLSSEKDKVNAL